MIEFKKTEIEELIIIKPSIYNDERGAFFESYNKKKYSEIGINYNFVQDNISFSKKNVLRGLHYQKNHPQGKLVQVLSGEVYDVAVDIRKGSKTYGKWVGVTLNDINKLQFWIPPGFAHGFLAKSDNVCFQYKCTDFYRQNDEGCLIWNDKDLDIDWGQSNPIISEKDSIGKSFIEI